MRPGTANRREGPGHRRRGPIVLTLLSSRASGLRLAFCTDLGRGRMPSLLPSKSPASHIRPHSALHGFPLDPEQAPGSSHGLHTPPGPEPVPVPNLTACAVPGLLPFPTRRCLCLQASTLAVPSARNTLHLTEIFSDSPPSENMGLEDRSAPFLCLAKSSPVGVPI